MAMHIVCMINMYRLPQRLQHTFLFYNPSPCMIKRTPSKISTIRNNVTTVFPFSRRLSHAPPFAPIHTPGIRERANVQATFPIKTCVIELTIDDKKTINIDVATAT